MFHRHLIAETYERALEEDPAEANRLRENAAGCAACAEATKLGPELGSRLAAWSLPAGAESPLAWRSALAQAIAPIRQADPARRPPARLLLAGAALVILLLVLAVPAAATSGPDSILYPVRGATDDLRWRTTPRSEQPRLEADLTAAYLWDARVSASRGDRAAYRTAMSRVFTWSDRLKADVTNSPLGDRPQIRATVTAGKSLLAPIQASGVDENQAGQVESVLNDVQGESQQGDGDHSGGG